MLKPLRSPIVFLWLTVCIAAWVYGASAGRQGSHTIASRIQRGWTAPLNIASYTSFSADANYYIALFEEPAGVTALRLPVFSLPPDDRDNPPFARINVVYEDVRDYGLVLPFLERGTLVATPVLLDPNAGPYTDAELVALARTHASLPAKHEYTWHIPNLLHDAALALALATWAAAALYIPTWKLWRNLTPAQRRRSRHACPNCGYDRSATPDAPCPECGNALPVP